MTAGCEFVRALAAEFALGLVAGPERAEALAHLETCPACRDHVATLSRAGDAVLLLAPGGEPRPGFETRVLDRLAAAGGPTSPKVARARRRWQIGLGAAAAAVLLLAGLAIGRAAPGDDTRFSVATMRTSEGERVGELVVGGDDQAFVFVAVPGWEPDPTREYTVRIETAGGRPILVENVSLNPGSGTWGTVLDVDPAAIDAVALLGRSGSVWCSAEVD